MRGSNWSQAWPMKLPTTELKTVKRIVFLLAILGLLAALGACSRDVTFESKADMDGGAPEAKEILKLNGFGNGSAASGDGALTIENVPGRTHNGPVGEYAVSWSRSSGSTVLRDFSVDVPAAHAGLAFKAAPTGAGSPITVRCSGVCRANVSRTVPAI